MPNTDDLKIDHNDTKKKNGSQRVDGLDSLITAAKKCNRCL